MSRREIVVNVLLGCLLLAVFALPFFLAVLALGYILPGANLALSYVLPGIAHPADITFYGLLVLSLIVVCVQRLGKRHWQEAFLCLAIVPVILSRPFAPAHSMFGREGGMVFLYVAVLLPAKYRLTRSGFLLRAAAGGTVMAVNTGLLGPGFLASIASDSVLLVLAVWFVVQARQNLNPWNSDTEAVPLAPTQV
jgi:hypothetical protein